MIAIFDLFKYVFQSIVLLLKVYDILAHLMGLSLLVTDISLESLVSLRGSLSFLELSLHVLNKLSQLTILFIAFL